MRAISIFCFVYSMFVHGAASDAIYAGALMIASALFMMVDVFDKK